MYLLVTEVFMVTDILCLTGVFDSTLFSEETLVAINSLPSLILGFFHLLTHVALCTLLFRNLMQRETRTMTTRRMIEIWLPAVVHFVNLRVAL